MESEEEPRETRFATARELGKHPGALLDAVIEGTRLVITRHGLPVAVMEATENIALMQRARRTAPTEAFEKEEEELDLASFGLPERAFEVLEAYERLRTAPAVRREMGWNHSEVAILMSKLEIERLTVRRLGGVTVTALGLRVIEAWKKRADES
jgi:antitoxin (DNA-binding transcriptional repressor) of toxin-antitoxin stability system